MGSHFVPVEVFITLGLCSVKVNTWILSWGKKLLEKPNLFTCDVQYIVFSTWTTWQTKRIIVWRIMTVVYALYWPHIRLRPLFQLQSVCAAFPHVTHCLLHVIICH